MAAGSTIIASMLTTIQTLVCGSGARRDTDFCIGTWTVQILPGVKFWGKYLPWFGWQLLRRPDWRFDQPRRYVSLATNSKPRARPSAGPCNFGRNFPYL